MSVKVDYLVVCSKGKDLTPILAKLLEEAIKTTYNEENIYDEPPEAEELSGYIATNYTKNRDDGRWICGFSVDFDIAFLNFNIASKEMGTLIREFSTSVTKSTKDGIEHLLKLHDPQLQCTLRRYGDEIFKIEMKLREALSLIFLSTYDEDNVDFYDLLEKVNVTPLPERAERMRKYYENQFFFLGFSDYVRINESKPANKVEEILKYIEEAQDFEDLQRIITANPIEEDRYADFLASLKERVNSIEKLRNYVAHNMPIPYEIIEDYNMAKEAVLESINDFLKEQANLEVDGETETG